MSSSLGSWWRTSWRRARGWERPAFSRRPRCLPRLEALEDRTVPATLTVLNNLDHGAGSLRDTIAAAASGDTIAFAPSLNGQTVTLTGGPIAVSKSLDLEGPGETLLTVSGGSTSRLFDIRGGANVTIADLHLTGGLSGKGGAIRNDGASSLTLRDDRLTGNHAVGDAGGNALGGAVYNAAGSSLTVRDSLFQNNQTNGTNQSFGGAIDNGGRLTVRDSTFADNQALGSTHDYFEAPAGSLGGAIENEDGASLAAEESTFTENQALGTTTGDALGGAICNNEGFVFPFTGRGVTTHLSDCTFRDNVATGGVTAIDGGFGGAVEDLPGVTLTVTGCTFQGNQANSGGGPITSGGAIDDSPYATVTIAGSTFLGNATLGTSTGAVAEGGAVDNFYSMTITGSTFLGNQAVGGNGADGINTLGQGLGGAIFNDPSGAGVVGNLTVSGCRLNGNLAVGGNGGDTLPYYNTDLAAGGAIDNLFFSPLSVSGCTILGNAALGGNSGTGPGGNGDGGGIDNYHSATLTLRNSIIAGNTARGGAGAAGSAGGHGAGGGIDNSRDATATIANCLITANQATGGRGGAGAHGGDGLGGGLSNGILDFALGIPDTASLTLTGCIVGTNRARGGTGGAGVNGGDGLGGGLFAGGGSVSLARSQIECNQAQGGPAGSGGATGHGVGGGVYIDSHASVCIALTTAVRHNHASTSNDDSFGTFSTC
jgi:hypothetical protein